MFLHNLVNVNANKMGLQKKKRNYSQQNMSARNTGSKLTIYSDRITKCNNIRGVLVEVYNKLTENVLKTAVNF
jgi:hypothetical protein